MMTETLPYQSRRRLFITIAIVILALPIGFSAVSPLFAQAASGRQIFLERPDPQHESCVRDTTYMRLHHWELLTQVRDRVMREGQRSVIGVIGLNKCRECHTSRERFCNHCHDSVNLYPKCFGCHYYP